jgi:hypothetical protein
VQRTAQVGSQLERREISPTGKRVVTRRRTPVAHRVCATVFGALAFCLVGHVA